MIRSPVFDFNADWNTVLDSVLFAIISTISGLIIYYGGIISDMNKISILSAAVIISFRSGHLSKLIKYLMFNKYTKRLILAIYNIQAVKSLIHVIMSKILEHYLPGIIFGGIKSRNDRIVNKESSCLITEYPRCLIIDIPDMGKFVIPRLVCSESSRMKTFHIELVTDDDILDISMSYPYIISSARNLGGTRLNIYSDDEMIESYNDDDTPNLDNLLSSDLLESI